MCFGFTKYNSLQNKKLLLFQNKLCSSVAATRLEKKLKDTYLILRDYDFNFFFLFVTFISSFYI